MEDLSEVKRLIQKGRRAENRGKAMRMLISTFVASWLVNLFRGFLFMIAVGIIHAEWIPQLPAIGYWWSFLVVVLLRGTIFIPLPRKDKS